MNNDDLALAAGRSLVCPRVGASSGGRHGGRRGAGGIFAGGWWVVRGRYPSLASPMDCLLYHHYHTSSLMVGHSNDSSDGDGLT